jgi:hypothetical protein
MVLCVHLLCEFVKINIAIIIISGIDHNYASSVKMNPDKCGRVDFLEIFIFKKLLFEQIKLKILQGKLNQVLNLRAGTKI